MRQTTSYVKKDVLSRFRSVSKDCFHVCDFFLLLRKEVPIS